LLRFASAPCPKWAMKDSQEKLEPPVQSCNNIQLKRDGDATLRITTLSVKMFLPPTLPCIIIGGAPFHRSAFSSKWLFIEWLFIKWHFIECTISSCFQNCKQIFCRTSASKVIDDLVRKWERHIVR
jgi:hypothetical protein